MVDVEYARGWDDCLEAVALILAKDGDIDSVSRDIKKLQNLVKMQKFEKIKHELGAFGLF